jgi:hypothetical protein
MFSQINLDDLYPLVHPHNWLLYRVPLRRIDDDHYVYFGNGLSRIYTTESLPDCIKHKLTMVLASPDVLLYRDGDRSFGVHALMNNCGSPHMHDIGWRASDTFFVVVISREDLDSLVGEALDREDEW